MKGKTHATAGLILGAASIYAVHEYQLPVELANIDFMAGCFLGSLLPDIDHRKSFLGQIIHLPVKHRTLTHSLFFLFLVSIFVFQYNNSLGTGLFLGIASHLLLDMFGRKSPGICLFYPFKKRYAFRRLR